MINDLLGKLECKRKAEINFKHRTYTSSGNMYISYAFRYLKYIK